MTLMRKISVYNLNLLRGDAAIVRLRGWPPTWARKQYTDFACCALLFRVAETNSLATFSCTGV